MLRYAMFAAALAFATPAFADDAPTAAPTDTPDAPAAGEDAAAPAEAPAGPDQLITDFEKKFDEDLRALKDALTAQTPQAGKVYEGVTADEMADIIRDAGYKAEVKLDSNKEAYIDSKASGLNFWVYLYRCDGEPQKCLRIQFQSSFSTKQDHQDKAIQWNVDKVVGRAYNIKDSTYFDYVIDTDGGVTSDNLVRNVELWDTLMGEFTRYIGW